MVEFDLSAGIDPTALTQVSGAQLKQLVDAAAPRSNVGFILVSDTTPDVANNPRYARFIWHDTSGVDPVFKRYVAADDVWLPINYEQIANQIQTAIVANLNIAIDEIDLRPANLPLFVYDTVAEMLDEDTTKLGTSFLALVNGYNTPHDLGGGLFRFDLLATDSTATVPFLTPTNTIGRWSRIRPDKPRPEHFADNALSDDGRINACLRAYGVCYLRGGVTYDLDGQVHLEDGNQILADGPAPLVQFVGNADGDDDNIFYVFENLDLAVAANDVKLSGFSIDCGYNEQSTKASSMGAIRLRGARTELTDLVITNFNIGSDNNNIAVVDCLLLSGQGDSVGLKADNLAFSNPGDTTAPAVTGTLTLIKTGGAGTWNGVNYVGSYARDVQVSNCKVTTLTRNATTQKATLRFFETQFLSSGLVTDNQVNTFAGPCIYLDAWPVSNLDIIDNRFVDVLAGVHLKVASDTATRPLYNNINVLDNHIRCKGNAASNEYVARGVWIDSAYPQGIYAGYAAYTGIVIRGNYIAAQTYIETSGPTTKYPYGIYIGNGVNVAPLINVFIDNNFFDVPTQDTADTANFNEAYSRCIMFSDNDGWDAAQVKVGIGNRRKDGKTAYLGLVGADGNALRRVYADDIKAQVYVFDEAALTGYSEISLARAVYEADFILHNLFEDFGVRSVYRLTWASGGAGSYAVVILPPVDEVREGDAFFLFMSASGSSGVAVYPDETPPTSIIAGSSLSGGTALIYSTDDDVNLIVVRDSTASAGWRYTQF